ncbi:hypothetical protein PAPYR_3921 [Paratrimastix pyriformis]|uniref:Uncharacterized protein n=1 Tax=Paratrimastix pyriformis TaxID=342808 RepID=A0ABQ8UKZ2_9EUKA|nr:hypothetical protein PAPYR_3921 [Paratrimastix pyriformis]
MAREANDTERRTMDVMTRAHQVEIEKIKSDFKEELARAQREKERMQQAFSQTTETLAQLRLEHQTLLSNIPKREPPPPAPRQLPPASSPPLGGEPPPGSRQSAEKIQDLIKQAQGLSMRVRGLEGDLAASRTTGERLQLAHAKEVTELRETLRQTTESLRASQARVAALERQTAALQQAQLALPLLIWALPSPPRASQEAKTLQTANAALATRLAEVAPARNELDRLRAQQAASERAHQRSLDARDEAAQAEAAQMRARIAFLEGQAAGAQGSRTAEVEMLQKKLARYEADARHLCAEYAAADEQSRGALARAQQRLQASEQRTADLEADLQTAAHRTALLEQEIIKEAERHEAEEGRLREHATELQHQLALTLGAQRSAEFRPADLAAKASPHLALTPRLSELEVQLARLQAQPESACAAHGRTIADLERRLDPHPPTAGPPGGWQAAAEREADLREQLAAARKAVEATRPPTSRRSPSPRPPEHRDRDGGGGQAEGARELQRRLAEVTTALRDQQAAMQQAREAHARELVHAVAKAEAAARNKITRLEAEVAALKAHAEAEVDRALGEARRRHQADLRQRDAALAELRGRVAAQPAVDALLGEMALLRAHLAALPRQPRPRSPPAASPATVAIQRLHRAMQAPPHWRSQSLSVSLPLPGPLDGSLDSGCPTSPPALAHAPSRITSPTATPASPRGALPPPHQLTPLAAPSAPGSGWDGGARGGGGLPALTPPPQGAGAPGTPSSAPRGLATLHGEPMSLALARRHVEWMRGLAGAEDCLEALDRCIRWGQHVPNRAVLRQAGLMELLLESLLGSPDPFVGRWAAHAVALMAADEGPPPRMPTRPGPCCQTITVRVALGERGRPEEVSMASALGLEALHARRRAYQAAGAHHEEGLARLREGALAVLVRLAAHYQAAYIKSLQDRIQLQDLDALEEPAGREEPPGGPSASASRENDHRLAMTAYLLRAIQLLCRLPAAKVEMGTVGGLQALAACLELPHAAAVRTAAECLAALATEPGNRVEMKRTQCVGPVLQLLKRTFDVATQQACLTCLIRLAMARQVKDYLGRHGAIPVVGGAVQTGSEPRVRRLAMATLGTLLLSDANKAECARVGAVPLFMTAVADPDPTVAAYAMRALSYVALHPACAAALTQLGAVPQLVRMMHGLTSLDVLRDLAVALHALVRSVPDAARELHDGSLLAGLVFFLEQLLLMHAQLAGPASAGPTPQQQAAQQRAADALQTQRAVSGVMHCLMSALWVALCTPPAPGPPAPPVPVVPYGFHPRWRQFYQHHRALAVPPPIQQPPSTPGGDAAPLGRLAEALWQHPHLATEECLLTLASTGAPSPLAPTSPVLPAPSPLFVRRASSTPGSAALPPITVTTATPPTTASSAAPSRPPSGPTGFGGAVGQPRRAQGATMLHTLVLVALEALCAFGGPFVAPADESQPSPQPSPAPVPAASSAGQPEGAPESDADEVALIAAHQRRAASIAPPECDRPRAASRRMLLRPGAAPAGLPAEGPAAPEEAATALLHGGLRAGSRAGSRLSRLGAYPLGSAAAGGPDESVVMVAFDPTSPERAVVLRPATASHFASRPSACPKRLVAPPEPGGRADAHSASC